MDEDKEQRQGATRKTEEFAIATKEITLPAIGKFHAVVFTHPFWCDSRRIG